MDAQKMMNGIESTLNDLENERVRITINKGVTIRALNTYYVMPTRYGYRITTMDSVQGLKEIADSISCDVSYRAFDNALVMKVESIGEALTFIKQSENIFH